MEQMKDYTKQLMKLAKDKVENKSKLTAEQIKHFKAKGKFSAIYTPYRTDDIDHTLKVKSGKPVIIYCNYETVLCIDAPKFFGYYKFFIEGAESSGWVTDMEFTDIKIIDDYADTEVWNCYHQYLMVISDRKKAKEALGNYAEDCELPIILGRVYGSMRHDYFKSLADADLYLYKLQDGEWKII